MLECAYHTIQLYKHNGHMRCSKGKLFSVEEAAHITFQVYNRRRSMILFTTQIPAYEKFQVRLSSNFANSNPTFWHLIIRFDGRNAVSSSTKAHQRENGSNGNHCPNNAERITSLPSCVQRKNFRRKALRYSFNFLQAQ